MSFPLVPKFYFGTGLSAKLCFSLYGMQPLGTAMKRSFEDGSVPKCNFGTREVQLRNEELRNEEIKLSAKLSFP